MSETIVILANSIKHGMCCLAGKLIADRRWVRVVADPAGSAITRDQASYQNNYGRYVAKPLQKISMTLGRSVPLRHQPENVLYEPGWVQRYKIEAVNLSMYADHPESLWGVGRRISEANIAFGAEIQQSLYLIEVANLNLYWTNDRKRRATFRYGTIEYDLPSTCPNFVDIEKGEREHHDYIVISLGERHTDGYHYKIIAAIL